MQKLLIVSLLVALNSCGQNKGPNVPEPEASSTADASPDVTIYQSGGSSDTLPGSRPAKDPTTVGQIGSVPGDLPGVQQPTTKSNPSPTPTPMPAPAPKPTPTPDQVGDTVQKTITLNPQDQQSVWEGWGTSLSGWANGIGASNFEGFFADLVFSSKDVKLNDRTFPGLDLNIARYNIGGGGSSGDVSAFAEVVDKAPSTENAHDGFEPYRDIDGFWKDNTSSDPDSSSFDWNRDSRQRSMLQLAKARGADTFEFYSNAPMWWMTDEKSSSGGALNGESKGNYMLYLAAVTKYARTHWGIPVSSLEAFNEPSSGKWKFPVFQQGCNIAVDDQAQLLGLLKTEMNTQSLMNDVVISSADEKSPGDALANHETMKNKSIDMSEGSMKVSDIYGKINVHTADNGNPFRSNGDRDKLRASAGNKKIWVSDYNDNDESGQSLAQSIVDDVNHLKPTAWIYSQVVEPYGNKGLVTANYHMMPTDANRGKPTGIAVKYYVMAQFSRFIHQGQTILGSSDDRTIVAYNETTNKLTIVSVNIGNEQTVEVDLSKLKSWSSTIMHVGTKFDGSKLYKIKQYRTFATKVRFTAEANSVSSLEISDAVFP
ncbi:MAG: hypothetical protein H7318_07575 [Oligoflexus sp.]|nr:hypothetical protein [Oligoflexus sp.]